MMLPILAQALLVMLALKCTGFRSLIADAGGEMLFLFDEVQAQVEMLRVFAVKALGIHFLKLFLHNVSRQENDWQGLENLKIINY